MVRCGQMWSDANTVVEADKESIVDCCCSLVFVKFVVRQLVAFVCLLLQVLVTGL